MSTNGSKVKNSGGIKLKQTTTESYKSKMKRDKTFQTKVVIRRLPPTMTEEQFIEQISPVPDHDYMYYVKADMSLGAHAFSRAYINFIIPDEIFIFKDKFDGYVFVDSKGNEYPAIVEFAPFQKIPKKKNPKKKDAKCGTILNDPDYQKFLESLKNPDDQTLPSAENYLEEIENREKEIKANNGVLKVTTPLIEFLKARKLEQQKMREEKREERKRKELEKKRLREEERRRRKAEKDKEKVKEKLKERDSLSEKEATDDVEEPSVSDGSKQTEPVVQVLKNPEREKDQKEVVGTPQKSKDYFVSSRVNKERPRKDWDRIRPKDRQKAPPRTYFNEKERSRRDKSDYKLYNKKTTSENVPQKHRDTKEAKVPKESQKVVPEPLEKVESKAEDAKREDAGDQQRSAKDKRDNSCPGNLESNGQKEKGAAKQSAKQSKAAEDDTASVNDTSKSDGNNSDHRDRSKDPRVERRIKNKDRPSLEIYRPGMRRFSTQRSSPQKEISTSASNSSSPSPTPPTNAAAKSDADPPQ